MENNHKEILSSLPETVDELADDEDICMGFDE